MEPLLSVINLKKHFLVKNDGFFSKTSTVHAVDGVNFSIFKGKTLGLVGESGSGKTTVGRCILRLLEPTEGNICFHGTDISNLPHDKLQSLRRKMQIVFQDPYGSLTPRLRVSSLLREPLIIHKTVDKQYIDSAVASIMRKVGLRPEHAQRFPHEFSGGQRQRICIARAMILNPEFIIADEPVSALDVSIRAQVLNLMAELQQEYQLTYLFISHDLSVVKYMCDEIAVMYLGKIVELATRDQLFNNHQHPYTGALLSAIPVPKIRAKQKRIILEGDIPSPMALPSGCRFHPRCAQKMDVCEKIEPQLEDRGNGHLIACHL